MTDKYKNLAATINVNANLEELIHFQTKSIVRKFHVYLSIVFVFFLVLLFLEIDTNILGNGYVSYNNNKYIINAPSSGKIVYYDLDIGGSVKKGQLLYSIDASYDIEKMDIISKQLAVDNARIIDINACYEFISKENYNATNNSCIDEIIEKRNNHLAIKKELKEEIKISKGLTSKIESINNDVIENVGMQNKALEYKIISNYNKNTNTINLKSRDLELNRMITDTYLLDLKKDTLETELSMYLKSKKEALKKELHSLHDKVSQLRIQLVQSKDIVKKSKAFSSIDGVVTELSEYGLGADISSGTHIASLEPNNTEEAFIVASVPLNESAWLSVGQEATVSLTNFPKMKYGYLTGRVKSFYFKESHYEAIISIEENNLNRSLPDGIFQVNAPVGVHFEVGTIRLYEYLFGSIFMHLESAMNEPVTSRS